MTGCEVCPEMNVVNIIYPCNTSKSGIYMELKGGYKAYCEWSGHFEFSPWAV